MEKSRDGDRKHAGYHSLTRPPPLRDLLIAQRSQPETFTNNIRLNLETVLGAGFK
jgi:hypothetical protein